MDGRADLVVLGGGPAGAVSALLAARDGLDVVLVDPERRNPRLEGLAPRLHRWLRAEGLLDGFDGIQGPLTRRVDWGGIGTANAEYVVWRGALDAHLRAAAAAAGARLRCGTGRPDGQGVVLAEGGRIAAPQVIDARGRTALDWVSRAPATLALCGLVAAGTSLEGLHIRAFAGGWVWLVGLPDGRIWAQVMLDAAGEGTPSERLLAALHRAMPDLGAIGLAGDISAREAAPCLARPVGDLRVLRAGDCLAAMDPLSGHGQFWAVSSALAVAAVRRTLAARPGPETEDLCRRFLTARAEETSLHQARIGRDFIRAEPRFADEPFWRLRRDFPDLLPAGDLPAAIEVRRSTVVRDGLVEEMDVLRTPRTPMGIGWFGHVPAADAWRCFSKGGVAALEAVWGPAAGPLARRLADESATLRDPS